MATIKHKITPFLWFNTEAKEAVNFYVSVFPGARIDQVTRYDANAAAASGRQEGAILTIGFELLNQHFTALNGGPQYHFTEAVSFVIHCETQAELDHYWDALSAGGTEQACGWLKDRFGLSWQVVPDVLIRYLSDPDPVKAGRAMQAMLQMRKIDIQTLDDAYHR